ncbi:phosphatidylinositol N-acetylglucosaminyltransferase subunit Y-domain-containing protein [Parasitella parasitica]|nr:phosphatidylinositol N-acetylglucosaminyltransferase subunit Y-domain-containing protein [Parasitella parasitica]
MQTHHRRRSSKSILIPRISNNNTLINNALNTTGQLNYARRMTMHLPETIPDTTYLYGYALLIVTLFVFTMSGYSIIASKYMPDTDNKILDWIKQDNYYCLLIPITAIVWIYWVLWNWMGMKFFRHN